MTIRVNDPSIMTYKWGQEGYYRDVIRACGQVTFVGADTGDIYYNGATIATLPLQAAAAAVELVSNSVQDDAGIAGTGAWTCRVHGLDGSYDYVTEDFTMDGAVAVVGTQLFLRVIKVEVLTAGTGGTNAGAIDCQAVGAGQVWNEIVAGAGVSESSLITVPRNKTLWITNIKVSLSLTGPGSYFKIWERPYGGAWLIWSGTYYALGQDYKADYSVAMAPKISEKTALKVEATTSGACYVASDILGFLTDN